MTLGTIIIVWLSLGTKTALSKHVGQAATRRSNSVLRKVKHALLTTSSSPLELRMTPKLHLALTGPWWLRLQIILRIRSYLSISAYLVPVELWRSLYNKETFQSSLPTSSRMKNANMTLTGKAILFFWILGMSRKSMMSTLRMVWSHLSRCLCPVSRWTSSFWISTNYIRRATHYGPGSAKRSTPLEQLLPKPSNLRA